MYSKYYQSELTYLREMGALFGAENPAIAGLLAEHGTDPDVERLLEGFAFLTARIRERVDDSVPEVVHALVELVAPHYLRSIPATTIVQFSPQIAGMQGRQTIPRGAKVASQAVKGTQCQFRTTANTELVPVALEDVDLDITKSAEPAIRLSMRSPAKVAPIVFQDNGIRLFLGIDPAMGGTLLLWLLRYCKGFEVLAQVGGKTRSVEISPDNIKAVGFSEDEALFPWPRMSPQGYRLLLEYYTQPAKFMFVDICGLDRAADLASERFELAFHFDRPPELPSPLTKNQIRLHCSPVVNLFETTANPVRRSAIEHDHLLRAADIEPLHMEVYSVDHVSGVRQGRSDPIDYSPFVDFSHAAGGDARGFYHITRHLSPLDDGVDTYFSIVTAQDVPAVEEEEVFTIELTCTNRFLPLELRAGSICKHVPGSPVGGEFSNPAEVTKPVRPPLGGELYWRLMSHLALNYNTIADANALRALLELYNFQALSDQVAGKANRLKAEGLLEVSSQPSRRMIKGAPLHGVRTTVELDETRMNGTGDAFLFGCILDALFADHITLNAFHETQLKLRGTQEVYAWQPQAGIKRLI